MGSFLPKIAIVADFAVSHAGIVQTCQSVA
jgi:hypothetical protein